MEQMTKEELLRMADQKLGIHNLTKESTKQEIKWALEDE